MLRRVESIGEEQVLKDWAERPGEEKDAVAQDSLHPVGRAWGGADTAGWRAPGRASRWVLLPGATAGATTRARSLERTGCLGGNTQGLRAVSSRFLHPAVWRQQQWPRSMCDAFELWCWRRLLRGP